MQEPADIWKPALLAGGIFGIWSGIPLLNIPNCACCSLIVGSGILASYMMVKSRALPVTWGRAALAGAISGAIAGLFSSMMETVLMAALGQTLEDNLQRAIDLVSQSLPAVSEAGDVINRIPAALLLAGKVIFTVVIFVPFGAIGGVIGRAFFEKRATPPPDAPIVADPAGPSAGGLDI
jgi:hypothetical protein